jgi:hypothetical protein
MNLYLLLFVIVGPATVLLLRFVSLLIPLSHGECLCFVCDLGHQWQFPITVILQRRYVLRHGPNHPVT